MNSGIYKITNIKNGKVYIGQSRNLPVRKRDHFNELRKNKHFNSKLQNAFNKYGEEFFVFEIIEECTIGELNDKEIEYIEKYDSLKNGYNFVKRSGVNPEISEETRKKLSDLAKNRKPSEEARKKLSERMKGNSYNLGKKHTEETLKKLRDFNKGKTLSEEHRRKIGESQKGKIIPEETRRKLSESQKGKSRTHKRTKLSDETKKLIGSYHKGKTISEEHKSKIKKSCNGINKKEKNPNYRPRTTEMKDDILNGIKQKDFLIKYSCSNKFYSTVKKEFLEDENFKNK